MKNQKEKYEFLYENMKEQRKIMNNIRSLLFKERKGMKISEFNRKIMKKEGKSKENIRKRLEKLVNDMHLLDNHKINTSGIINNNNLYEELTNFQSKNKENTRKNLKKDIKSLDKMI